MAQPSKNYTTRRLLAAGLARGSSLVRNVATSDDAAAMRRALEAFGARIESSSSRPAAGADSGTSLVVHGFGGHPRLAAPGPVDAGNAGAVLRFILGIGALLPEVSFITGFPQSLGKRPNSDLLDALEQMGCRTESRGGCLPITLRGGGLRGGKVSVNGANSSQFVSSLLFLAPLVGEPVDISVTGKLVSKAPVRQTLETLRAAGISINADDDLMRFHIEPGEYRSRDFTVNGDWPGSTALLAAAAAVAGSEIQIGGLYQDAQGERAAADALERMGARVEHIGGAPPAVRLRAGVLRGVEFDGDTATDAVLALAGAACFARGRSRFYNIANLRIKECDRISEPVAEMRKIGVRCWEGRELDDPDPDAMIIEGNPDGYEGGIEADGRGDHRVIMLLTIIGLGCRRGLTVRGAEHISKSYPDFFRHLEILGANLLLRP